MKNVLIIFMLLLIIGCVQNAPSEVKELNSEDLEESSVTVESTDSGREESEAENTEQADSESFDEVSEESIGVEDKANEVSKLIEDSKVPGNIAVENIVVEESVASKPDELNQIFERHNTKVKSLSYEYIERVPGAQYHGVMLKNNFIRVTYPTKGVISDKTFDTVYFNTKTKTAESYCLDPNKCGSVRKIGEYDYDKYIKTPIDWINEVVDSKKGETKLINGRSTTGYITNVGTLWMDNFYGVPLQIDADIIYAFDEMKFNLVSDGEVTPS
jgi:hypothetical protein